MNAGLSACRLRRLTGGEITDGAWLDEPGTLKLTLIERRMPSSTKSAMTSAMPLFELKISTAAFPYRFV